MPVAVGCTKEETSGKPHAGGHPGACKRISGAHKYVNYSIIYLLVSALEAQGGLVRYDDLLVGSKKTEQNNAARMGQMENKNHWSDNRKRTDQLGNTNRRQKVKYCCVRELNMFGQRLTCDCKHTVYIIMKIQTALNAGNSLTSWETVNYL
jgi:hypothetical protein